MALYSVEMTHEIEAAMAEDAASLALLEVRTASEPFVGWHLIVRMRAFWSDRRLIMRIMVARFSN